MSRLSSAGAEAFTLDQQLSSLRPGKVVCVGRNYAAHAAELNNPVPEESILFIKPATALVLPEGEGLTTCPWHDAGSQHDESLHYETEIALLIGSRIGPEMAGDHERLAAGVAGIGVALDLTKRELQTVLKKQGHPWELAKAFDGSCPVGGFVTPQRIVGHASLESKALWTRLGFDMRFNGELRQQGRASQMLTGCIELLSHICRHFTLNPGDLVLTGTPAGVGALAPGAVLEVDFGIASDNDPASPIERIQNHTFRFADA